LAAPGFERTLDLALGVALGEVAALVALLLAACERDLDLHLPVLEVDARGNEREAALTGLPEEGVDLAAVQEELAVAVGLVVLDVALRVLVDVGPLATTSPPCP
jgi:hypothetical protein